MIEPLSSPDHYLGDYVNNQVNISWKVTLTESEDPSVFKVVYGDYERPDSKNPWLRLKDYCKEHNVLPAKIQLYMLGAKQKVFFEDEHGLDGVCIKRGAAKDQLMDGSSSTLYQSLTVLLIKDDCSGVKVSKYLWPHNSFEAGESERDLTVENLKDMIFASGSEKLKNEELSKYIYGGAL
tara:strand:- start:1650 stop:2189 length:540 start_codon:yes stop_codon:yes gene_type:complete